MPSESRDFGLFIADIVESAGLIVRWTESLSMDEFLEDRRTFDAVLRNLTVMGEAAKHIPEEFRQLHPTRRVARYYRISGHCDAFIL